MTISIEESLLLVRTKLLSIAAITDLVEDRVYTDHFYEFDDSTVKMPLIIIDIQGGKSNYGMGYQSLKFDIYCYSKTSSSQTVGLYDLVYNNLHATRLENANLSNKGMAYETERPDTDYNTKIRAWFSQGKFTINLAG
jgi:hypothetical protein